MTAQEIEATTSFWCPLEFSVHPRAGEADEEALAWVDRFGFWPETHRSELVAVAGADFFGRFAPDGNYRGLVIAACWAYWGFAFDDYFCDRGPLSNDPAAFTPFARRLQRMLEAPRPHAPTEPLEAALYDVGQQLRTFASPAKVHRFCEAHAAFLAGVQWQIANSAARQVPDLDEYLVMRCLTSGGGPTYALVEVINDLPDIPAHELHAPAVSALLEMAIIVEGLDNDRYSRAKEQESGEAAQNVFTILDSDRTSELTVVALRDRIMARYLELHAQVLPHAGPELRRHLLDLNHGIRGNAEWGLRAGRYHSPTGAASAEVTQQQPSIDVDAAAPSSLPSIAWWWDDELSTSFRRKER